MSDEKPERCPNCHSVGCLAEYPVLVDRDRGPRDRDPLHRLQPRSGGDAR